MENKHLIKFLDLVQEIQKSLEYIFPNLGKFGTLNLCYDGKVTHDPFLPSHDLEKLCLDFHGYTIFPAKIEYKTISGKKLADGFKLYHPDGELIQDVFSVSGAVSLFAKVVFDEIFKVYEDRVQADALAEFFKEQPQLPIYFRSNN